MVIAIDGPAGAGKSSVAQAVAQALGFTYLDSGAMYRTVALAVLGTLGSDGALDDAEAVTRLAARLEIGFDEGSVTLDGEPVGDRIRTPEVTVAASRVSTHPGVRRALVARQRALIESGDYVAEGRDIGTEVSPGSPLKIFLNASAEERARRRAEQSGQPYKQVLADQRARDSRDIEREHGALRAASDAVELDTTELTPDQVVERIVRLARERGLVNV